MRIVTVILTIFFILVFGLIIFGILHKPVLKPVKIPGNLGVFNKQCGREKVSCNTDDDCEGICTEAQSGESYVCKALPDTAGLTEKQKQILGANGPHNDAPMKTNKFCVPEKAVMSGCDVAHGGIPVLSGWSGGDPMSFDCMCAYPEWASSRTCNSDSGECVGNCQMNPGVCQGGIFDWDLTQRTQEPTSGLCICPSGSEMVIDYNSGIPRCVPEENVSWYSDLDMTTGRRGAQPIINVSNIRQIKVSESQCQPDRYTQCPMENDKQGCCMMPDAVCCGVVNGKGMCCPKGWKCDNDNNRCVEDVTSCKVGVKCDKGCCPLNDGVCCGDGLTCCPSNFPVCDPINKTCNPLPTPMIKKTCTHVADTQCGENCCPERNATCCPDGKHCCPMEYPVCDIENNQCKTG